MKISLHVVFDNFIHVEADLDGYLTVQVCDVSLPKVKIGQEPLRRLIENELSPETEKDRNQLISFISTAFFFFQLSYLKEEALHQRYVFQATSTSLSIQNHSEERLFFNLDYNKPEATFQTLFLHFYGSLYILNNVVRQDVATFLLVDLEEKGIIGHFNMPVRVPNVSYLWDGVYFYDFQMRISGVNTLSHPGITEVYHNYAN